MLIFILGIGSVAVGLSLGAIRQAPGYNLKGQWDSDGDGLADAFEQKLGLNPFNPEDGLRDEDGDGLTYAEEWYYGTDPQRADTDGDGVDDYSEIFIYGTNPLVRNDFKTLRPKSGVVVESVPAGGPPLLGGFYNKGLKGKFTPDNFKSDGRASDMIPVGNFNLARRKLIQDSGWMSKHGRFLKVWHQGAAEVVELDAQAGDSFGMMRVYPRPKAGTYVLLWNDCGRPEVSAKSNRYSVRTSGDAINIFQEVKCNPIAGQWRAQGLVFQIPASMVPAELWLQFETEDNDGVGAFVAQVQLIRLGLELDVNRDGEIDPEEHPFEQAWEFWVNNDYDRVHLVDDTESEEDDLGANEIKGLVPDWQSDQINSKRDLEDFFRCQFWFEGDIEGLASGDLFLGLKFVPRTLVSGMGLTHPPVMKLFRMITPGSDAYLKSEAEADQQVKWGQVIRDLNPKSTTPEWVGSATAFILPSNLFIKDRRTMTVLAEACEAGDAHLFLEILRKKEATYESIVQVPVSIFVFKDIKQWYEHWTAGNGNGALPLERAERCFGPNFRNVENPRRTINRPCIVLVHGWNMEAWEKERYAETALKRLWWLGYEGDLILFSWPCTNQFATKWDALVNPTNYDQGEWTAWQSAATLQKFLAECGTRYRGNIYVLAHSMGNIVVSEALRLQSQTGGPPLAKVYIASQAAVSAQAYDGSLSTAPEGPYGLPWHYRHPAFGLLGEQSYGPDTPNVYPDWFKDLGKSSAVRSAVVGKVINFFNQNDWALSDPIWGFNQMSKPDWAHRPQQPWDYGFNKTILATAGEKIPQGFYRAQGLDRQRLRWESPPKLGNNYEIMALAAESYVRPLGACAVRSGVITSAVNLQKLWPHDDRQYRSHVWHSAQFRSNFMRQQLYWVAFLEVTSLRP